MDRRNFLETTFFGGLVVGSTACAGSSGVASEAPLDDAELARRLHRMDRTIDRMDRVSDRWFVRHRERASGREVDPRSLAEAEQLATEGELLRASMRSMFLTSSLSELPQQQQADPRVVERLRRMSGEADFAVFGTLARLETLEAEQLETLDELAAQPDFIDRVLENIDTLSHDLDVPASRRLHLRRLAKHLSWRLERQPMSALIRETVDAVGTQIESWARRLQDSGPQLAIADGDPRWIERTDAVVRLYGARQAPLEEPPSPTSVEAMRAQETADAKLRVKQGQIMTGVGIGLAVLGAGGIVGFLYAGAGPAAIVSAVVTTIGVILLIVGAVFWGLGNRSLKRLGDR